MRKAPSIRIGNASATGALDKNIIRRYIRRQLPRIRNCYEKRLLVEPTLAGTVVITFTIAANGTVATVASRGMDSEVGRCVEGAIKRIQFPKPKGGGTVEVRYPFAFQTGDAVAKSRDKTAEDKRTAVKRAADRNTPVRSEPYQAGMANPLRPLSSQLEDCFRDQTKRRYGAAVVAVNLAGHEDGTVPVASASGWGDEVFDSCLSEVAKKAKWPEQHKAYRCPVSFGPMPIKEAPGVDISPSTVSITLSPGAKSHDVANVAEVVADTSMTWKISALHQLLREHRDRKSRPSTDRWVSITGPMFLRAAPEVPMKVVYRALKTMRVQNVAPVFTTWKDNEWQVLPRRGLMKGIPLPVAPIPLGTGQRWHMRGGLTREMDPAPSNAPVMAVLVTREDLWLGTTIGDRRQFKRNAAGEHDWAALRDALRELRTGPFENQTRIELGSDEDSRFADVARAIEVSVATNFDRWEVVDPRSLAVRFKEQSPRPHVWRGSCSLCGTH